MDYTKVLNEKQYEAASTSSLHTRVVAGAGAGKTRVLTYRIAFLLTEMGADPESICAFTFTNKAAGEMKQRIVKLVPSAAKDLTLRTFHSFAAYFLRQEITVIDYPRTFTIMDEDDQTKIVKDIVAQMGYRKTDQLVKLSLNYIGNQKMRENFPDDITIILERFPREKECLEVYTRYEEAKDAQKSLDFDDLLLYTNKILSTYPDIRAKWQRKISYILVDEFQDTNDTEFKMIQLLMKPSTSLYVVGDPDQNIYTWRGANQRIILNLEKIYPDIETIILDRNYRSTQTILDSANKLIDHNKFRIKKNLYTKNNKGEPIVAKACGSNRGEADYVARQIKQLVQIYRYSYSDIAVLYRSNYITLEFEQSFMSNQIPYKIFGGVKFYQRAEIKDVIAYFNLIVNTDSDLSFERIMNVPRRGVGDVAASIIKKEAGDSGLSMYEYVRNVDPKDSMVKASVLNSLKSMIYTIDKARDDINANEEVFSKTLEDMLGAFDYYNHLLKEDEEKGEEKVENVKALFEDLRHYLQVNPEATFEEYLQNIALVSSQDEVIDGDFVTLMTVHTAKGLEYPVVFVVRLNENVFPHVRSLEEGGKDALEEERRLFYVAMTRAKERLYLSCSTGYSYVTQGALIASSFLKESGNEIVSNDEYNPYRGNSRPTSYFFGDVPKEEVHKQDFTPKTNGITSWNVGDIVIHKKFGRGVVISLEGDDIIKVNFDEHGTKTIMGNHPSVSKGEK